MRFEYELVKDGETPTWAKESRVVFQNPVSVGDEVTAGGVGNELLVVAIVHYPHCSVLYYHA